MMTGESIFRPARDKHGFSKITLEQIEHYENGMQDFIGIKLKFSIQSFVRRQPLKAEVNIHTGDLNKANDVLRQMELPTAGQEPIHDDEGYDMHPYEEIEKNLCAVKGHHFTAKVHETSNGSYEIDISTLRPLQPHPMPSASFTYG